MSAGAGGLGERGNLDFASADIVFTLAMVVAAIAGGLALRRHRIVRAQRLWAIGFGFSVIIFHNHFPQHWTWWAPMMLFLAVGPRTRWSPWVWGAASVVPEIALATGGAWRHRIVAHARRGGGGVYAPAPRCRGAVRAAGEVTRTACVNTLVAIKIDAIF